LTLISVAQSTKKADPVKLQKISFNSVKSNSRGKSEDFVFGLQVPVEICQLIPHVVFKGDYSRSFTLYAYLDSVEVNKKWILNYFEVARGVLNSYGDNSILFSPQLVKGFKLVVDNADNIPLKIDGGSAFVFPVLLKAYFADLSGRYVVTYGDHSLSFPDYDLASFKERIPLLTDTVNILSEKSISLTPKKPLFSLPDNLLWLVLLAVIVLLSFFTFKMIKAKA
jgi:hypothetical protein